MNETNKKPNSKGSYLNAYKLSNISLEDEISNDGSISQLIIGCDDDDQFHKESDEGRLMVYIELRDDDIAHTSFDLEDFLIQAKRLCPHLFITKK